MWSKSHGTVTLADATELLTPTPLFTESPDPSRETDTPIQQYQGCKIEFPNRSMKHQVIDIRTDSDSLSGVNCLPKAQQDQSLAQREQHMARNLHEQEQPSSAMQEHVFEPVNLPAALAKIDRTQAVCNMMDNGTVPKRAPQVANHVHQKAQATPRVPLERIQRENEYEKPITAKQQRLADQLLVVPAENSYVTLRPTLVKEHVLVQSVVETQTDELLVSSSPTLVKGHVLMKNVVEVPDDEHLVRSSPTLVEEHVFMVNVMEDQNDELLVNSSPTLVEEEHVFMEKVVDTQDDELLFSSSPLVKEHALMANVLEAQHDELLVSSPPTLVKEHVRMANVVEAQDDELLVSSSPTLVKEHVRMENVVETQHDELLVSSSPTLVEEHVLMESVLEAQHEQHEDPPVTLPQPLITENPNFENVQEASSPTVQTVEEHTAPSNPGPRTKEKNASPATDLAAKVTSRRARAPPPPIPPRPAGTVHAKRFATTGDPAPSTQPAVAMEPSSESRTNISGVSLMVEYIESPPGTQSLIPPGLFPAVFSPVNLVGAMPQALVVTGPPSTARSNVCVVDLDAVSNIRALLSNCGSTALQVSKVIGAANELRKVPGYTLPSDILVDLLCLPSPQLTTHQGAFLQLLAEKEDKIILSDAEQLEKLLTVKVHKIDPNDKHRCNLFEAIFNRIANLGTLSKGSSRQRSIEIVRGFKGSALLQNKSFHANAGIRLALVDEIWLHEFLAILAECKPAFKVLDGPTLIGELLTKVLENQVLVSDIQVARNALQLLSTLDPACLREASFAHIQSLGLRMLRSVIVSRVNPITERTRVVFDRDQFAKDALKIFENWDISEVEDDRLINVSHAQLFRDEANEDGPQWKLALALAGSVREDRARQRADVILVLDNSYSMEGMKLATLKDTCRRLFGELRNADSLRMMRFSVTYKWITEVDVRDIQPQTSTYMTQPLLDALKEPVLASASCGYVILLTDGGNNDGRDIRKAVRHLRRKRPNLRKLVTVGFGNDSAIDEDLLRDLADPLAHDPSQKMFYRVRDVEEPILPMLETFNRIQYTLSDNLRLRLVGGGEFSVLGDTGQFSNVVDLGTILSGRQQRFALSIRNAGLPPFTFEISSQVPVAYSREILVTEETRPMTHAEWIFFIQNVRIEARLEMGFTLERRI